MVSNGFRFFSVAGTLRGFLLIFSKFPHEIPVVIATTPVAKSWIRRVFEIREGSTRMKLRIYILIAAMRFILRGKFHDVPISITFVFCENNYYFRIKGERKYIGETTEYFTILNITQAFFFSYLNANSRMQRLM